MGLLVSLWWLVYYLTNTKRPVSLPLCGLAGLPAGLPVVGLLFKPHHTQRDQSLFLCVVLLVSLLLSLWLVDYLNHTQRNQLTSRPTLGLLMADWNQKPTTRSIGRTLETNEIWILKTLDHWQDPRNQRNLTLEDIEILTGLTEPTKIDLRRH